MKSLWIVLAMLGMALVPLAEAGVKNVVVVHGAFADGSGWRPIATILEHDGYTVYVVQEPLTSWDADLAATRSVLDRAGPCVLVAHSWGGMIITEVGDRPSVRSLVYVAAFEPDVGETAGALQGKNPPAGGQSVVPAGGGFVYVNPVGIRQGLRRRCTEGHGPLYGDLPGADCRRRLWRQSDGHGVVEKAELRGDSAAGSPDQSRPRTIHGAQSQVRDARAAWKPRNISPAPQGGSRRLSKRRPRRRNDGSLPPSGTCRYSACCAEQRIHPTS